MVPDTIRSIMGFLLREGSQEVPKFPVALKVWGVFSPLILSISVAPISVFMYSRVLFLSFPPLILLVQGRINRVIIVL